MGFIPGSKDPLEEGMATHSSILTWNIPWIEEPGGLQFMGSPRDEGAWWDAVYGVAQSQTLLKRLSSSSSRPLF